MSLKNFDKTKGESPQEDAERHKIYSSFLYPSSSQVFISFTTQSRSLKIAEKVSFNIASEWTKVNQKWQKLSILASFWKPEACSQTVLPDRSLMIGQKLVENAKILRDFQTMRLWTLAKMDMMMLFKIVFCLFLAFKWDIFLMIFKHTEELPKEH